MVNLGAVIQQLQCNYDVSDRRNANIAVENDRRLNKEICVHKKPEAENVVFKCFADAVPPVRRLESIGEKWDNGETTSALGALALTAINLPEDISDLKEAGRNIHEHWKGNPYHGSYTHKDFQHEFSFFRGTMLEPMVDMKKTKHPKLAKILLNLDKPISRTKFGQKILSWLKVEENDLEEVKKFNSKTKAWELAKDINGEQRFAYAYKGSKFGVLTARAMSRTTLIGTGVIALLEAPKLYKALTQGDTISKKADNLVEQTAKSGINIAATTAGIAYGGAIGSKYGKAFGSLIGMGIGAVVGNLASKKLQEAM